MKLLPKTWLLLGITVLLVIANGWTAAPAAAPGALPSLPAVVPDDVTKIVISSPIDRLEIDRTAFQKDRPELERWQIVAPLDYPADVAQVRALLRLYGTGVPMDAKIDTDNLKDYQLEDQDSKVVELYTTAETPALQVIVGRTVGPNTAFVRLPGSRDVYRAAVGQRQRYDQAAADWRDRVVLDVDRDAVRGLQIQRGAETLAFTRSGGRWAFSGPAPFALDSDSVEAVARALGRIRAGDIHNSAFPGGFDAPIAVAQLSTGVYTRTITLGSASDDRTAYIAVDGRPEVFAVSGQLGRMLMQPATALRDRTIFDFKPEDVRAVALTEGSLTVAIARDAEGPGWTVTQPANMDVDPKLADALAILLGTLRGSGIPDDDAFQAGAGRIVITLADGSVQVLELGQPEKDAGGRQVVRVRAKSGTFQLKLQTIGEIERVFGR